ncbi:MAG TPA: helix-turn-helix transcriptional regulator [Terriglobales bacterium]|nr:helix-turn-helix transcriptional regulator [Terriglobales bacterium]
MKDHKKSRRLEERRRVLGSKLRGARLGHRLTQAAVAQALGVSQSNLSKVEAGEQDPGFLLVERLSAYYNVSLNGLSTLTREESHRSLDKRDGQRHV